VNWCLAALAVKEMVSWIPQAPAKKRAVMMSQPLLQRWKETS